MNKIVLKSPAKINIGLNIIRKREDGYHDLETIFYPLMLSDILTFEKADDTILESNSNEINSLKTNLIFTAIELLETIVNRKLNVKIYLEKNIPIGAGLGGGSSNAAATLKALNQLFELNLNFDKLSETALKLGSDVPFFLEPFPCFASSRGEIRKNIQLSLSQPILIINPGIHISTKWAFQNLELTSHKKSLKELCDHSSVTIEDIKEYATNDFETNVFQRYPEIKLIKDKLDASGADFVSMTGTGSTIYGVFSNLQKARWLKENFDANYFTYINFPVNRGSIT
ncbi:MAG: 4-(cytidine 5'-diphospho)-2-C-methyl-D-erythritol kinase [Ignavibacteriaceae bacterium]|jgi:4-diphosphocytidyl-2-C-methyl-D-erythritol kinase